MATYPGLSGYKDPYQRTASNLAVPRSPSGADMATGLLAGSQPRITQPMIQPQPAPTVQPQPMPGRMAAPTVQPTGSLTGAIQQAGQPQPQQPAGGQMGAGDPYWSSVWQGIEGADKDDLTEYINFLYSMPDYKGRNEANRAAIAQYARNLRLQKKEQGDANYGGLAKLGDTNASLMDQLSAMLAARGSAPGGGVAAGGLSNLAGKTSASVSDFLTEREDMMRRDKLARDLARMDQDSALIGRGLGLNLQEQNDGGLMDDIAGLLGGGAGFFLGGPGGAALGSGLGKSIGGLFGGDAKYEDDYGPARFVV